MFFCVYPEKDICTLCFQNLPILAELFLDQQLPALVEHTPIFLSCLVTSLTDYLYCPRVNFLSLINALSQVFQELWRNIQTFPFALVDVKMSLKMHGHNFCYVFYMHSVTGLRKMVSPTYLQSSRFHFLCFWKD